MEGDAPTKPTSGQVGDERLRSVRLFAARSPTCLVDHFPLYFGGEWGDHVQAGIGQDVGEKNCKVGVALDDRFDDLTTEDAACSLVTGCQVACPLESSWARDRWQ